MDASNLVAALAITGFIIGIPALFGLGGARTPAAVAALGSIAVLGGAMVLGSIWVAAFNGLLT